MSRNWNTKGEEDFLTVTVFQQCRAQGKLTLSAHRCLSPTVLPARWEQHCFYSHPSALPLFLQDARHTLTPRLCTCWSLCLEGGTPEIHGPPFFRFFFLLKCHLSCEIFLPHDLSLCFAFFFSFAFNTNGTHCICYWFLSFLVCSP